MPKYIVRHGVMRQLGVFGARGSDVYSRGSAVITRTNRGLEAGEVLCEATEHSIAQLKEPKGGQILHRQTEQDAGELRHLREQERYEYQACLERIVEQGLDMKLIDVERLYGGERVIVYYLSEERVDFRHLVKILAKEFQTRIEMRQIGVRDEAKLMADYGDCGKPVCCNTHLSEMPPVSMRMAKLQKATLDPSKISGRCGRLKCCLRYEYDTYQEMQKDLPPIGSEIITNNGKGKVLAHEILAGQLLVQNEEMRRVTIDASEVLTILKRGSGPQKKKHKPQERAQETTSEPEPKSTQTSETQTSETQQSAQPEPGKPGDQQASDQQASDKLAGGDGQQANKDPASKESADIDQSSNDQSN